METFWTVLAIVGGIGFFALVLWLFTRGWQEENDLSKATGQTKLLSLICYKGFHDFFINGIIPHISAFWTTNKTLVWEVILDDESSYTLPGEEWHDWNKGGGKTYNIFQHRIDSAMWAWRKNPVLNRYEYAAYCHVNQTRVNPPVEVGTSYDDNEVMLRVKSGARVRISLKVDEGEKKYIFSFSDGLVVNTTSIPFTHDETFSKEITANFGGNNVAPNKIKIQVKRL